MPKKPDLAHEEAETEKTFEVLRRSVAHIIAELEAKPKSAGDIGWPDGFKFSDQQRQQLNENILLGFADWAMRAMGKDFERYVKEGERNLLSDFLSSIIEMRMQGVEEKDQFSKAFGESIFKIPQTLPKKIVHLIDLAPANNQYRQALKRLTAISRDTKRVRDHYLEALKQALPGMKLKLLERFIDKQIKGSDIAARYALQYLPPRSSVGIGALKKYFKDFQTREGLKNALARSREVR